MFLMPNTVHIREHSARRSPTAERAHVAVKSAERVVDLLELLASSQVPLSHGRLAAGLGIPKSSLTHLLRTLEGRGWLKNEDGSYSVGSKLLALKSTEVIREALLEIVGPMLAKVSAELDEFCGLNVLAGRRCKLVAAVETGHPLRYSMKVGGTSPLYVTSPGKVLLAFSAKKFRDRYLAEVRLEPLGPKTIGSRVELERQLNRATENGFAVADEEFTPGIVGVATPIKDRNGTALAAMNVAAPKSRMPPARRAQVADVLKSACESVMRRLESLQPPG